MELLSQIIDIFLHLDKHLDSLVVTFGPWTYAILFLIVFCETGLVVTPFLPGDSLLFATGAVAAASPSFNVHIAATLVLVAAIVGDAVNYSVGAFVGNSRERISRLIKAEHLERTAKFFDKYGGKTIVIARFVPIVRTVAPFLAGVGTMQYPKFLMWNVLGAVLWVGLFTYAGYFFGNLEFVRKNFTLVILAIIVISLIPPVLETLKARRERLDGLKA